ncbi:hypothetical protein PIB30_036575 [Stylosanthes scabra]|uniref:Uncharacterized protein n=1 Tax=Stylosanthes scabra TaxID=79078 RepID=A0ABU6YBT4_9FABA|nr:hypothetical protein [Stylosanthes scabra]
MGLGAFQHLPSDYINHKILNELVRSYNVFTNKITTSLGEFLITSEKVGHAFGLNYRGDLFEKKLKEFEKKLNDEEKEALNLFKGKTFTFVENMVKECPIENEEEKRTFKRAFALFIQKCFLLPTSTHYISPIHLPVIRDIDNTRERNWAHHVHFFLMAGIKDFQDKGTQAVKGCHFVLQIIYFKESDTNPEPEAEPEPIIEFEPQPRLESNIEGGAEPIIEVGHEPPAVLEEMMAECERAEQDIERKKEEADAEIKACDEAEAKYRLKRTTSMENASESEIDLAIRKTVKDVVVEAQEMEKQEREAAPTLNKM